MTVYILGPITGVDNFEAAFQLAEDALTAKGHTVVNPCKIDYSGSTQWHEFMRTDIRAMMLCDAIYMLDGWRKSNGARIEYALAMRLGFTQIF